MSTVLAYALSLLINMGIVTSSDVNRSAGRYSVIERDGKNIVLDSANGTELIVF